VVSVDFQGAVRFSCTAGYLQATLSKLVMPISCHFKDCKALLVLSPSYVKSAIASGGLYICRGKWCL